MGLTQAQLAERLDVSRAAVTQWESGKTSPTGSNLKRVADALETDVAVLFGGQDPSPPATDPVSLIKLSKRDELAVLVCATEQTIKDLEEAVEACDNPTLKTILEKLQIAEEANQARVLA